MTQDFQFYPTPEGLAQQAWAMFKDKHFIRVLEPSAGNGDLLAPFVENYGNRWQGARFSRPVDVLELDASKHPLLQSKGAKVVGHDFLEFTGVGRYSHVIMNPPFAQGVQHLLHAWAHLYDGEIVCVLNAEALRNPYSKERQHLARLVQEHGRAEFVGNAFSDAERQTEVEVVLIHLVKRAQAHNLVGDLLGELSQDRAGHEDDLDFAFRQQLTLPRGFVEDAVLRFDAAVVAAKGAAEAQAKAAYYSRMLGRTFSELHGKELDASSREAEQLASTPKEVRALFVQAYDELKDRAWMSVLRSTEVLSKLSSKAQKRIEAEFENIKTLEFTSKNVYGFLQGLCDSAGAIQMDMVLDVFSEVTRYHEDNTVFYMGWKSNGRHRTAGMRLKTTRFILPGHGTQSYSRGLDFDSRRQLADFDKVFAMLDGKHESKVNGLLSVFEDPAAFDRLRRGSREQCAYFEVRYYPKRGTIHFFPRSKALMDRLNRVVGQHYQWLPPSDAEANEDFHQQYAQAERFDAELREAFVQVHSQTRRFYGRADYELGVAVRLAQNPQREEDDAHTVCASMDAALAQVMANHGWNPQTSLEHQAAKALPGPALEPSTLEA